MKTFKAILLLTFMAIPYLALSFLFSIAFDTDEWPRWVGLGMLLLGLICMFMFFILPEKEEKGNARKS